MAMVQLSSKIGKKVYVRTRYENIFGAFDTFLSFKKSKILLFWNSLPPKRRNFKCLKVLVVMCITNLIIADGWWDSWQGDGPHLPWWWHRDTEQAQSVRWRTGRGAKELLQVLNWCQTSTNIHSCPQVGQQRWHSDIWEAVCVTGRGGWANDRWDVFSKFSARPSCWFCPSYYSRYHLPR